MVAYFTDRQVCIVVKKYVRSQQIKSRLRTRTAQQSENC